MIVAVVEAVLEPLVAARDHALQLEDPGAVLPAFFREAVRLHMLVVSREGREPARNDRYVEVVVRGLLPTQP